MKGSIETYKAMVFDATNYVVSERQSSLFVSCDNVPRRGAEAFFMPEWSAIETIDVIKHPGRLVYEKEEIITAYPAVLVPKEIE